MKRICFVNHKFVLPVSFIFLLFLSESSLSQALYWKKIYDAEQIEMVRTGFDNSIYILTQDRIFKSVDDGGTWNQITNYYTFKVSSMFVKDNLIYAGSKEYGIYVSTNGGSTWSNITSAPYHVTALEVHPNGTLFAGTQSGIVFTSSDSGSTWNVGFITDRKITSFAFTGDGKVFAGVKDKGIYRSENNGLSWQQVFAHQFNGNYYIASNSDNIVVSGDIPFAFAAKTTDGGNNWVVYNRDGRQIKVKIATDGAFWGLGELMHKSTNEGNDWQFIGALGEMADIHIDNDKVYIAGNGLYRYEPGVHPYAGNNFYPLRLENEWHYLKRIMSWSANQGNSEFYSSDKRKIIDSVLVQGNTYYKLENVNHWHRYQFSDNKYFLYNDNLTQNPERLIVDFNKVPSDTITNIGYIVEDWVNFYDTVFYSKGVTYFEGYGNNMYRGHQKFLEGIGLFDFVEFYLSINGGTRTEICELIEAIIVDQGSTRIYTYTHKPVITITPVTATADTILELTFQVDHHFTKFYQNNTKMYNFVDTVIVQSFYYNGTDTVLVQDYGSVNIPLSKNYKLTYPLDMNLMRNGYKYHYRIKATDIGLVPHISYAPETGYYILTYDPTLDLDNADTNIPTEYALFQNYPNPFNPVTVISWQSPEYSLQRLKIYDILGGEVATLVNEYRNAGRYEISFDASGLPSGVYIYKFEANAGVSGKRFNKVGKMIFLK